MGVWLRLPGNEAGRLRPQSFPIGFSLGGDMKNIDFYFDFLSPFAYLARHRLSQIASQYHCTVTYKPIDLALAKKAIGNVGPTNREMPIKLRYLGADLNRWAQRYGIPLNPVKNHNSHQLNLGTFFAETRGQSAAYVELAYRLTWGEGGAPDDESLLRQVATDLKWDPEAFLAFIASPEAERRYAQNNQEAISKGVFGVPTMLVDDQMWWGNDRLFFLEEYLAALALPGQQ